MGDRKQSNSCQLLGAESGDDFFWLIELFYVLTVVVSKQPLFVKSDRIVCQEEGNLLCVNYTSREKEVSFPFGTIQTNSLEWPRLSANRDLLRGCSVLRNFSGLEASYSHTKTFFKC